MKLHRWILLITLSVFLVGCSSIDEAQWNSVQFNMSIEQVKKILGSPKETITEKQEMLDVMNGKINQIKDLLNEPAFAGSDALSELEDEVEHLDTIYSGINNDEDVKILQYEINDEHEDGEAYTSTREVILYRDRVLYYNGMHIEK